MIGECKEKCKDYQIEFVSTDGQTKSDALYNYFKTWKKSRFDDYDQREKEYDSQYDFVHLRDALHLCKNLRNIVFDGGGIEYNDTLITLANLRPYLEKVIESNKNQRTEQSSKSRKINFYIGDAKIDLQDINPIDKQSCDEVKSILKVGYQIYLIEKNNTSIEKEVLLVKQK
jgi:hypothetical protein